MRHLIIILLHLAIFIATLPYPVSAEDPKRFVEKPFDVTEILSIPPGSQSQVIFVNADSVFQKISPLTKELSASQLFSKTFSESIGMGGPKSSWVSDVPFFSLIPKRGERETIIYFKFQLPKMSKRISRATLLTFGPSIEELEMVEGKGYEETLVKLMSSVTLWFSPYVDWKETTESYLEAEEQYLKIKPEVSLGTPTLSAVYSGCYLWDVTEILEKIGGNKTITLLLRNENSTLGYGVNIFSRKMHRLWPQRIDKSSRLVLEFED